MSSPDQEEVENADDITPTHHPLAPGTPPPMLTIRVDPMNHHSPSSNVSTESDVMQKCTKKIMGRITSLLTVVALVVLVVTQLRNTNQVNIIRSNSTR